MKQEHLAAGLLRVAALICAALIVAIVLLMLVLAWPLLQDGQFSRLLSADWQPDHGLYGIRPMLFGSLFLAVLAVLISLPLSLGTAVVLAVLAPRRVEAVGIMLVRGMAAVPTVVYGFTAVFLLVPLMRTQITGGSGLNLLTASLVLALLIAPTMIVFFVNGLRAVPESFSRAAEALGCRPVQKLLLLLLPQAWPALLSGLIMGFGRAVGDTLISLMVAGNSAVIPQTLSDSTRTLTAHIALVIAADFASIEFRSIFAGGIVLYLITVAVVAGIRLLSPGKEHDASP